MELNTKRKAELLDDLLDMLCERNRIIEVIEDLISIGTTEKELIKLHFDKDDIKIAIEESNEEE